MDVARSETVEADPGRFIRTWHDRRVLKEDERRTEEAWKESVERYNARKRDAIRAVRVEYHRGQAVRLRTVLEGLVAHHETQAERLCGSETAKGA